MSAISERLEKHDIQSDAVYNGEEALQYLEHRQQAPVVMVLDSRMPGIDRIEVLRRVKRDHADVEVIILTGPGGEEDRRLAIELGAFAYRHKPVDVELLARTMKEATMKARGEQTGDARQLGILEKMRDTPGDCRHGANAGCGCSHRSAWSVGSPFGANLLVFANIPLLDYRIRLRPSERGGHFTVCTSWLEQYLPQRRPLAKEAYPISRSLDEFAAARKSLLPAAFV